MSLVCTICGHTWETIPPQAVLISRNNRVAMYDIDGEVHSVRHVMTAEQKHNRWHQNRNKIGCELCFPPEPPAEIKPEVVTAPSVTTNSIEEPESEDESLTSMQMAFRKINRR